MCVRGGGVFSSRVYEFYVIRLLLTENSLKDFVTSHIDFNSTQVLKKVWARVCTVFS